VRLFQTVGAARLKNTPSMLGLLISMHIAHADGYKNEDKCRKPQHWSDAYSRVQATEFAIGEFSL